MRGVQRLGLRDRPGDPAAWRRLVPRLHVNPLILSGAAGTHGSRKPGQAPGNMAGFVSLRGMATKAAAGAGSQIGLGVLSSTRPIDRLRYQARLVFDHFDKDADGALTPEELAAYIEYCDDRFGKGRFGLDELYTPLLTLGEPLGFEAFDELVRKQVNALSNGKFLESHMKGVEVGKLLYKCAITSSQLASALAVFKLVDFNNDGYVRLDEYCRVQGIEKRIYDAILEDADTNEDGFLTFEDFLSSYAKERPVFLSMAVMAAHTAAYWLIFNSPLDTIFKAVLAVLLILRPALVTNPVIKVWQIGRALIGRARAENAVSGSGAAA